MADAHLIALCPSARLQDGAEGQRFEVLAGGELVGAFVVRHRGVAVAYLNRCAHVAMELDWVPGQFFDGEGEVLICATHGALYAPRSGRCLGGPCQGHGGLMPVPVLERGGMIYWQAGGGLQPPTDTSVDTKGVDE